MSGRDRVLQRQADALSLGVLVAAVVVCGMSAHLVWHVGWLPGLFLAIGMLLVWGGLRVFRDQLVIPLHQMVEMMETMRQTGQWVKLPVAHRNELGSLAAGFNRLVEHVEAQQRRLREQIVELQRVNEELDQLASVKDEFLQTINHQLRTPMTAILEGLELLRDPYLQGVSAEQRSYLEVIRDNAVRLKGLVEEMLDLSLLQSGRRPLNRQADDLRALLERTCATWRQQTGSARMRVEGPVLPPVYIDAKAIEDVINHLLRNAIRHAPASAAIEIRAGVNHHMVVVSVRNEGVRLTTEQLKRLFQPFVHLHTPDAPGSQGSGLGLAFCRQVVERHGGAIRVESDDTSGTTVTITLPVASPAFLFIDACRLALEEAESDGQYGLCLVIPQEGISSPTETISQAETLLRKNTHRGDRFIRLDDQSLAIVAVADGMGLAMMIRRLRGVVAAAQLPVRLDGTVYPVDGDQPERILDAARRRVSVAPQQLRKEG